MKYQLTNRKTPVAGTDTFTTTSQTFNTISDLQQHLKVKHHLFMTRLQRSFYYNRGIIEPIGYPHLTLTMVKG